MQDIFIAKARVAARCVGAALDRRRRRLGVVRRRCGRGGLRPRALRSVGQGVREHPIGAQTPDRGDRGSQPNIDQQLAMLGKTLISRPTMEQLISDPSLGLQPAHGESKDAYVDGLIRRIKITSSGARKSVRPDLPRRKPRAGPAFRAKPRDLVRSDRGWRQRRPTPTRRASSSTSRSSPTKKSSPRLKTR